MIVATISRGELAFGSRPLLDGVDFELSKRERVALVGRNGAGKSSLLKVLSGQQLLDDGRFAVAPGERVALLGQEVPSQPKGTVGELVGSALADVDGTVAGHSQSVGSDPERLVAQALSRLDLEPDRLLTTLSGGQMRRVLLARVLVGQPGLLLLDEPTNHLDLAAIEWLEQLLRGYRGAVVFTSHDRRFLSEVATRIVELDRGALRSWPGDYQNYLRRRDERLAAERQADARFDKRLAEEEVWIRQGIKARRTRNEGRVRRLIAMRKERAERRELQGMARLQHQAVSTSGRRVIEAKGVRVAFDDLELVNAFSLLVMRGDRIGLIGPNGVGKTSLLKVLLGLAEPAAGDIVLGTKLELAFADQHRTELDESAKVQDCVLDGTDHVLFNGGSRHVVGYLRDFLFTAEQVRGPVAALSGGERNRLQLARLFARPTNFLVLDEPTNDLDIETLELLESLLSDYEGTLIVVSHDREFLDNVVTSVLAFEGEGVVHEYVGGYSDWERARKQALKLSSSGATPKPKVDRPKPVSRSKLGFNETRELAALPGRIEDLESRQSALQQELADPALYKDASDQVAVKQGELADVEAELERAYERWSELETADG